MTDTADRDDVLGRARVRDTPELEDFVKSYVNIHNGK